jgi:hypothetical protein
MEPAMRSTPAPAMRIVVTLLTGALLGGSPSPAHADRPPPELLRTDLNVGARAATIVREMPRPADPVRVCGTPDTSPGEVDGVQMALRRWVDESPTRPSGGLIRIAFHVITADGEGNVTDGQIAEQIGELNRDFADTGYRFELSTVDRTENAGWFRMTPGSGRERQAKQALALDPAHRLNVYTCSPGPSLFGWASLPWSSPEGHFIHGVVIHHASLPGGAAPRILSGTVSHEVGHYLGLFHSAEGAGASRGLDEAAGARFAGLTTGEQERIRAIVPVYRPSLIGEPAAPTVARPEIVPDAGAEPEDGRVLSYRGAYPNPFHAETALRFTLPVSAAVSLRIYSVTGQLVRTLVDAQLPPGDHSAMFRAGDLPSGAYFAVLKVGRVQMNRTLMLIH